MRRPMPLRRHSHRGNLHFDGDMSGADEAAPSPSTRAKSSSADRASGRSSMSADGYVARPAPSPKKNNLGTRYGETRHSPVVEVPFRRAHQSRPSQVLSAYYDDHGGLAARGIIVHGHVSSNPQPFPNNRHFAPPPAP